MFQTMPEIRWRISVPLGYTGSLSYLAEPVSLPSFFLTENSASMKVLKLFLALAIVFTAGAHSFAQLSPEKAENTFKVADGLEFKLWASEPLFVNPTCMDI